MKRGGWVVRHRRLAGAVLLLGGCLLLGSGRMFGQRGDTPPAPPQREVIATSVPVTPETSTEPASPRPPVAHAPGSPRVSPPAPLRSPIQPVSFVPDPTNNTPTGQSPAPAAMTAAPAMLPPTALLSGMTSKPTPMNAVNPIEGQATMLSVE